MLWKKKLYCYIFVAHKIFYFVYPHIFAQVMPLIWLFCLFMYSNLRKNGQVIRFFSKEQNHHRALACFLLFSFSWQEACFLGFIFCLFACTNGSDLKNLPYNLGFSFWNSAACLLRKVVQDRLVYPASSVGCTSHGVRVQAEHFTLVSRDLTSGAWETLLLLLISDSGPILLTSHLLSLCLPFSIHEIEWWWYSFYQKFDGDHYMQKPGLIFLCTCQ